MGAMSCQPYIPDGNDLFFSTRTAWKPVPLPVVNLRWLWLAIVLLLSLAPVTYLQPETPYRYEDSITVTAKAPEPDLLETLDIPASITVITFEDQAPVSDTVAEVLASAAGVNVRDFGGVGSLKTISIRGSSSNQVVVLLDGVKLNSAANGSVDLSSIPIHQVAKIEILRGGAAARLGNAAVGGVVNIVLKKPDAQFKGSLNLRGGSFSTGELGATANGQLSAWRYLVHLNGLHTAGNFTFRNTHGSEFEQEPATIEQRCNNWVTAGGGVLKVLAEPLTHLELQIITEFQTAHKGIPGMVTFPSPHATQNDSRLINALSLTRTYSERFPFTAKLALDTIATETHFQDQQGEQTGVPIDSRQKDRNSHGLLDLTWHCSRSTALGVAAEGWTERLNDNSYGSKHRESSAVGVRADTNLLNGTLWLATAGRVDLIQSLDPRWTYKIGLRLRPWRAVSIKANAGSVFRAPSFNEMYLSSGFMIGNPDLSPERGMTYDLGLEWSSARVMTEITFFQNDMEDLIQYVLLSRFQFKPLNIGKARSRGVEWQTSWRCTRWLTTSVSYTYNEAVDRTNEPLIAGNQIPGRPLHDTFVTARSDFGKWKPFVEYYYLSGNYLTRSNSKKLADRFGFNAGLTIEVSNHLQAAIEVKNVTDEHVEDVRGFPLPSRSIFASITALY